MSDPAAKTDADIRKLFPIVEKYVYFNHAATGPLPGPTRTVIEEVVETYLRQGEFELSAYFSKVARARIKISRLINAGSEEIAFMSNTSEGIYTALVNIPWQPGDRVVVMEEVFPTVRYVVDYNTPGVEKVYRKFCDREPVEIVREVIAEGKGRVRAVVIDHVQFFHGAVVDLRPLGDYLAGEGIYFIVDAMQSVGALDLDVRKMNVDFLAVGGGKWVFTPSGTGFLYVNKKNFERLNRLHTGWLGAGWKNFENFESLPPLFGDARRYEPGTKNMIGICGLAENCRLLSEFGLEHVEKRILAVKERLRTGLLAIGYEVITPAAGLQSGIVTARPGPQTNADACRIFDLLKANNVVVSLRNQALRFSPHFYNTAAEADRIIEILRRGTD